MVAERMHYLADMIVSAITGGGDTGQLSFESAETSDPITQISQLPFGNVMGAVQICALCSFERQQRFDICQRQAQIACMFDELQPLQGSIVIAPLIARSSLGSL